MFTAEAFKAITDLADARFKYNLVPVPDAPGESLFVVNGEVRERFTAPGPLVADSCTLTSLDSLAAWVHAGKDLDPVLYVSVAGVTAIRRACPRRSRATWQLGTSDVFKVVKRLKDNPDWIDQKKAIRLTRMELGPCIGAGVADQFRKLKSSGTSEAESNIEQRGISLGKSITAKVTGTVPETVVLDVPVLADPFAQVPNQMVTLEVDNDPQTLNFLFFVRPGDLERAVAQTTADLARRVTEAVNHEDIPVLMGAPA